MLAYYVVVGVTAVVLMFLWHHGRQKRDAEQAQPNPHGYDPHGRGIADEAATAVGDVARQIIETRR